MNLYEGRLGDARELLRAARQDSPQERRLRGEATLPSTDAEKRLQRLVGALESLYATLRYSPYLEATNDWHADRLKEILDKNKA